MSRWWLVWGWIGLLLLCGVPVRAELNAQEPVLTGRGKAVESFMALMVERQTAGVAANGRRAEIDRRMLALLAPYYFDRLGVDPAIVTINKYSPDGFRILAEKGDYVFVRLLRKASQGPNLIVFKTAEDHGRYVIEPAGLSLAGNADPSLVTPWFYAVEQRDLALDTVPLPTLGRSDRQTVVPAPVEVTRGKGVDLVRQLLAYLDRRDKLPVAERRALFAREILPLLARGYTDLYGVDAGYYEDLATDPIRDYKITGAAECFVVLGCAGCRFDRYYFKIVVEDGAARILPSGIDNVRKTFDPVWFRE